MRPPEDIIPISESTHQVIGGAVYEEDGKVKCV